MLQVFGSIFACYQDVVDVAVAEVQTSQDLVDKPLNCLYAVFLRPNGILANSYSPNGVVMAVLGMSLLATGIW